MSALDRLKLLGDRADPLTRWQVRTEAEQRNEEREHHRERAAIADSQQVMALRHEVADLRHELANMNAQIAERGRDMIGIADSIIGALDKVPEWVQRAIEARIKLSEAEMCGKIAEKFGELMGRLAALDPMQARTARGEPFRFANEKADSRDKPVAIDLPNWRRGNGTVVN